MMMCQNNRVALQFKAKRSCVTVYSFTSILYGEINTLYIVTDIKGKLCLTISAHLFFMKNTTEFLYFLYI